MYDYLLVGAGITNATICAYLKETKASICVVDTRNRIGGNCYDYKTNGTYVHCYGPHIFHSTSPFVTAFLSCYTGWTPFSYSVQAEIEENGQLVQVPFPYCVAVEKAIGRKLSQEEIIEKFFVGYSKKMWDMEWGDLPNQIKGRVPKDTKETPEYFPGQFVAMPSLGYTHMIENMFDGAEIILGAPENEWTKIEAKKIIYTGRPDLIPVPRSKHTFGEQYGFLEHRSVDIEMVLERNWQPNVCSINFCSLQKPFTRMTSYKNMTGGNSDLVSKETPRQSKIDEVAPFYPIPLEKNLALYTNLVQKVKSHYNINFSGRLGTYRYLDMFQSVANGLVLAKKLVAEELR